MPWNPPPLAALEEGSSADTWSSDFGHPEVEDNISLLFRLLKFRAPMNVAPGNCGKAQSISWFLLPACQAGLAASLPAMAVSPASHQRVAAARLGSRAPRTWD